MGNNHRRSRGCETCRRKKVKCDEKQPFCLRCEKKGLVCSGPRGMNFVGGSIDSVEERAASISSSAVQLRHSDPLNVIKVTPQAVKGTSNDTPRQVDTHSSGNNYWYSPPRNIAELLNDETLIYVMSNMTLGTLRTLYNNALPFELTSPHPQKMMMNHCLLAMAKISFGRRTHDVGVLNAGLLQYGGALGMLNSVLSQANGHVTSSVLVSVYVLSLCEGSSPTSKLSWMVHIAGLERLFTARGPMMAENSSMLERSLLESCRPVLVFGSFFTQRPSVMSNPDWKPVPSSPQWSSGTYYLLEHLGHLPKLFLTSERRRQLAAETHDVSPCKNEIWTGVAKLHHSLKIWEKLWSWTWASKVEETYGEQVDSSQAEVVLTCFNFDSFEAANSFVLYHTVVLLLASIPLSLLTDRLYPPLHLLASLQDVVVDDEGAHLVNMIKSSAMSICRSLKHQHRLLRLSRNQPDFNAFFPMHVVKRVLFNHGSFAELEWFDDISQTMLAQTSLPIWANMEISDDFIGFRKEMFAEKASETSSYGAETSC